MSRDVGRGPSIAKPPGRTLATLTPVLVALAVYLPFADRGFTSEDFLLLRFVDQNPPWEDLHSLLLEPWLGITVVQFYRPLAVVLLALEQSVFGTTPLPYNLVHLAVHLLCVVLVFRILEHLVGNCEPSSSTLPALIGASVFALYPLHPNAVSWIGSYANLFGNALLLMALWLWMRVRDQRDSVAISRMLPSLGLFVLSLGCYESAVAFPVLIVAYEVLIKRCPARQLFRLGLALGGLSIGYLLWRKSILGVALGGYRSFSANLLGDVAQLLDGLGRSLLLIPWPSYEHGLPSKQQGALALWLFVGLLVLSLVAWLLRSSRRTGASVFGFAAIIGTLAPFAFRAVWPAEGRYWYLASVSVALFAALIVAQVERQLTALRPARRKTLKLVLVLLPAVYLPGLIRHLGWMSEAALEARRVREAILAYPSAGDSPLFLADVPMFVTNEAGVNLAQIYHYGLSDSLGPPFSRSRIDVLPLLGPARAAAAALRDIGPVLRLGPGGHLSRVEPVERAALDQLVLLGVGSGTDGLQVGFRLDESLAPERIDMIVATAGNSTRLPVPVPDTSPARAGLPKDFVSSMSRLYPDGRRYVWLEARDAEHRLLAVAPAITF